MSTSITISLDDALSTWLHEQVEKGGHHAPAEYVEELLRKEQACLLHEQIDAKLLAALESKPIEVTPEFWDGLRREAAAARLAGARPG